MQPLVPRNLTAFALGALERFPVLVIDGARRVGKSTLAEVLVRDRPHTSVSFDDAAAAAAAIADPRTFLEGASAGRTMVIDEVQRAPEIILAVKAEVDRDPRPARFVLTGSSDLLADSGLPDSLAGRAVTVRLRPFSQGEVAGRKEDFVARLLAAPEQVGAVRSEWDRARYARAIHLGGYPEVRGLDSPWRDLWLDSYIERLTARDAQSVVERVSANRLRAVLRLLAANQAGELVKARLAQDAGISANSVTTCLDALGRLFVIEQLPPWTANLRRREIGRPKVALADPGLAAHLAKTSLERLAADTGGGLLGPGLEGLVLLELMKQKGWSQHRWDLAHYRDRGGLEVDLVVELSDGQVILIEVKAAASYRPDHFTAIKKMAEPLGDRFAAGVVLTTAGHGYRHSRNVFGLPVSALWEDWEPSDVGP